MSCSARGFPDHTGSIHSNLKPHRFTRDFSVKLSSSLLPLLTEVLSPRPALPSKDVQTTHGVPEIQVLGPAEVPSVSLPTLVLDRSRVFCLRVWTFEEKIPAGGILKALSYLKSMYLQPCVSGIL